MILFVDPEQLARRLVTSELSRLGYDVVAVGTAPEALRILRHRADVEALFADRQLTSHCDEGDGWALVETARALHPHLPVIYGTTSMRFDPRWVAGARMLLKPYDMTVLAKTLQDLLACGAGPARGNHLRQLCEAGRFARYGAAPARSASVAGH